VRKARRWLTDAGLPHVFHDFRKQGLSEAVLSQWIDAVGWEPLLNRQGTTWRKLPPALRAAVVDAETATEVMMAQTAVVKRPVVVWPQGAITVGFSEALFEAARKRAHGPG